MGDPGTPAEPFPRGYVAQWDQNYGGKHYRRGDFLDFDGLYGEDLQQLLLRRAFLPQAEDAEKRARLGEPPLTTTKSAPFTGFTEAAWWHQMAQIEREAQEVIRTIPERAKAAALAELGPDDSDDTWRRLVYNEKR